MKVAVFIGSESDFKVVEAALSTLKEFDVPFTLEVTSAHRSPDRTVHLVKSFEEKGALVFIAVAGKAAHLAGVVASHTGQPVIAVPVASSTLSGFDALLSSVQMPKGVPVACMGLGESGAINAALLAVQILSLKDSSLRDKFCAYKQNMAAMVEESSRIIKEKL
ncbi:MAG: 5-(carboxyamino)imidazole ribonucleotide mutase [Candidatus Aminicenantes bacterium]|nr:5-(carboxyamino)imidazole ribonucleotide mutase [Candidatus Aminicenantes bacterium]